MRRSNFFTKVFKNGLKSFRKSNSTPRPFSFFDFWPNYFYNIDQLQLLVKKLISDTLAPYFVIYRKIEAKIEKSKTDMVLNLLFCKF